ncbi:MAG: Hsp70 family protein, partial [bacterium]|nr:Hsp70 family protein [bacterium]
MSSAGHDVKDVVITCPAYFGDAERKATMAAGEIAGLNVLQLLDEPVAAAMHYGLNKSEGDRTAIVYDLGGGTFDVTVVAIEGGNVRVVCSDGNHRLGGKNWDERVVEYFASKFAEASGTDKDAVMGDADTLYDLQLQAEIAKQTLTTRASAKVKVAFEGNSERIEITRETFDEITKDLLDQTVDLTQKMFDLAATQGVARINDFLLVGGSTRMPQVMAMVKERFAPKVDNEPSPFEVDEAVAKGAATFGFVKTIQSKVEEETRNILGQQGASEDKPVSDAERKKAEAEAIKIVAEDEGLSLETVGTLNDVEATTVASRSYGIRVLKGGSPVVYNMIVKQSAVPAVFEREFPVSEDNAEKLPLQVFANNVLEKVASLDDSVTVGDAVMMLPPGLPKGAMIRIKFTLTEEGVLSLDATDVTHGTPVHAEFEAKDGLTKEQIEAARKETADLVIE